MNFTKETDLRTKIHLLIIIAVEFYNFILTTTLSNKTLYIQASVPYDEKSNLFYDCTYCSQKGFFCKEGNCHYCPRLTR